MKRINNQLTSCIWLMLILLSLLASCKKDSDANPNNSAKGIRLKVGEGINFETGKVTTRVAESDMAFKYLPPQSPHGWRYNPITGQFEYQAQVATYENYPLLEASRTASFDKKPDISKLTVGDVNSWTEDEYNIGPGRFMLVRALTTGKHYLVKLLGLEATSNDPSTWVISFDYEPVDIALGATGTAGQNMTLKGTLTYREFFYTKKIVELDLSSGKVTEKFDGYGVSRNSSGNYVYVKPTGQLALADATGKETKVLPAPAFPTDTYTSNGPTEAVLSPDGTRIAVQLSRYTQGTLLPAPTVVILDANGQELTSFSQRQGSAWLPDGQLVMASAEYNKPFLVVVNVTTQSSRTIALPATLQSPNHVAVSPDGKTLAFSGSNRICLIGTDGSGFRQLTQSGRGEITPVWSPDGQYLALQQNDAQPIDGYEIIAYRVSDGKSTVVVDNLGNNREPSGRMYWLTK